ncbi:hypothetical protein DUNSADRAFT_13437 [Dunaliella salina]|uniref:Uncharacterized protein n=1 Tax=Dunaliella salina TaxID=3046 RepID=A0ABQ7G9E3_DUNSA|nr:hypothetical protein DUNSADRAFT_13437 [Dunaliella salina]|eukprot:KAF5831228.1 hypothetical protein DUNSADRAFT_13437 [Dunaliella salina]
MHRIVLTLLSTAALAVLLLPRKKKRQPQHGTQQRSVVLPLPPPPNMPASEVGSPSSAKKCVSPRYPHIPLAMVGLVLAVAVGFYQRDWIAATKVALVSLHLFLAAATGAWLADQLLNTESTGKHQGQLGSLNAASLPAHPPNTLLNGVWIKAPESESMAEACDLMHLGGLVRLAISSIKGVEFHITADEGGECTRLDMAVFSIISWFKVKESYPLSGAAVISNRRDLRRGKHTARCRVLEDGGVELDMEWGEPYPGHGQDVLSATSGATGVLRCSRIIAFMYIMACPRVVIGFMSPVTTVFFSQ